MQTTNTSLPALPAIADPSASSSSTSGNNSTAARLKAACQQFEGEFMSLVLQEMRKTIPKDTLLGDDGHTQEIFTGMMDDQVAQQMAKQGGSNDLAMQMYRQLAGRAGVPDSPAPANSNDQAKQQGVVKPDTRNPAADPAPPVSGGVDGSPTRLPNGVGSPSAPQEHIDTSR